MEKTISVKEAKQLLPEFYKTIEDIGYAVRTYTEIGFVVRKYIKYVESHLLMISRSSVEQYLEEIRKNIQLTRFRFCRSSCQKFLNYIFTDDISDCDNRHIKPCEIIQDCWFEEYVKDLKTVNSENTLFRKKKEIYLFLCNI